LKEIARIAAEREEESESEDDWVTNSEGSDYEGSEDDDEYFP